MGNKRKHQRRLRTKPPRVWTHDINGERICLIRQSTGVRMINKHGRTVGRATRAELLEDAEYIKQRSLFPDKVTEFLQRMDLA